MPGRGLCRVFMTSAEPASPSKSRPWSAQVTGCTSRTLPNWRPTEFLLSQLHGRDCRRAQTGRTSLKFGEGNSRRWMLSMPATLSDFNERMIRAGYLEIDTAMYRQLPLYASRYSLVQSNAGIPMLDCGNSTCRNCGWYVHDRRTFNFRIPARCSKCARVDAVNERGAACLIRVSKSIPGN